MKPLVFVSTSGMQQIQRHAQSAYPHECCGVLLGRDQPDGRVILSTRATDNAAAPSDRHHRFVIPPNSLLEAEREAKGLGLEVVGFYHSHPDAQAVPSATDGEHAWEFYSYLIVSVQHDTVEARSWRWSDSSRSFQEELLHIMQGR